MDARAWVGFAAHILLVTTPMQSSYLFIFGDLRSGAQDKDGESKTRWYIPMASGLFGSAVLRPQECSCYALEGLTDSYSIHSPLENGDLARLNGLLEILENVFLLNSLMVLVCLMCIFFFYL
jgi:hypothetical protein